MLHGLFDCQMRFPCFIKLPSMAMALSLLLLYICFTTSFFSAMFTLLALLLSILFQYFLQKFRQAQSSYKFKKLGEVLDEMKPDELGTKLGVFHLHEPLLELADSSVKSEVWRREEETRPQPAEESLQVSPQVVQKLQDSPRPSASESSNCLTSDEETSPDQDVCRSTECSETSLSDDENLFEIDLPDGHYVKKKSPADLIRKPLMPPDHLKVASLIMRSLPPESELRQHGLKELLSEINEEDNLIEIDIARGSIKCSTL